MGRYLAARKGPRKVAVMVEKLVGYWELCWVVLKGYSSALQRVVNSVASKEH